MTPDPAAPHYIPDAGSQAVRDLDMTVERRLTRLEEQQRLASERLGAGNKRFTEMDQIKARLVQLEDAAKLRSSIVKWSWDIVKITFAAAIAWWLARRK